MITHLYSELAVRIAATIDKGVYLPGDKLPGVRVASRNEGVSPATVIKAYQQLEIDGYVESRPRSGYYVQPRHQLQASEPKTSEPTGEPELVRGQGLALRLIQTTSRPGILQLGANVPDHQFMPTRAIARALRSVANEHASKLADYEVPPGLPALRNHISRRMAALGAVVDPNDVVITSGCQEAVHLSLKCVTQPGDVVAVESPTYYGLLQVLDTLGLKAIEIPTHPREGISIEALRLALEHWPIKACVLVANFANPLGAVMPDDNKVQLTNLLNLHPDVTLIEDDIYGDLNFNDARPSIFKSHDTNDQVIYCSSYSKSLSAGLRIGWAISTRHREQLSYLKFVSNCSASGINQHVLVSLLENGSYERHLRGMRSALAQNMARMSELVAQHFPPECRVTRPQGGLSLWVELPAGSDATELSRRALAYDISIAPGELFSTEPEKYRHCLRLNVAVGWGSRVEKGIAQLGVLSAELLRDS